MRAHRYFKAAQNAFFKWEDNGTVLVWGSGLTIAFAPEIATVMRRVGSQCLPPLNTIAMLLSACRSNWPEVRQLLMDLCSDGTEQAAVNQGSWEAVQLRSAIEELDRIHSFPLHLRESVDARAELMAMALQNRHSTWTEAEAKWLADTVEAGLPADVASQGGFCELLENLPYPIGAKGSIERAIRDLVRDVLWLRGGLQQIDPEKLDSQLRTGLAEPIETAGDTGEEEEPTPRELIARLVDEDGELGSIARLAQNLFAVVHFPRTLSEPDELPLGGVSDITNRGQLDQLVLTELANDDLTLAVRVAVNEAMYLRRESPPKARSQERFVLLDSGLCMWGMPRIYGIAAALAMAATADRDTTLSVWRGDGEWMHELALTTKVGIEDAIHDLSTAFHCAEAMPKFLEHASHADDTQFVVITCADALETREFQSYLQTVRTQQPIHVLSVDRDGGLEFSLHASRGMKRIRNAKMDLDAILKPATRESVLKPSTTDLPLILQQDQLPLRVSFPVAEGTVLEHEKGTLSVTSDGRLLLWEEPGLGAIEVSQQLGKGWIHWIGESFYNEPLFVFGKLSQDGLKLIRVCRHEDVEITQLNLTGTPTHVAGFGGAVFVSDGEIIESFFPGKSEPVGRGLAVPPGFRFANKHTKPSVCSARSRFLTNGKEWIGLTPGTDGPQVETIAIESNSNARDVFDCLGFGPAIISERGHLRRLWELNKTLPVGMKVSISSDGRRVVTSRGASAAELISLPELKPQEPSARGFTDLLERPLRERIREKQLRNKFLRIGAARDHLVLQPRNGDFILLGPDGSSINQTTTSNVPNLVPFEPISGPLGTSFSLSVATFADGSQAFLDSRFMLHLKCSDARVPEVSLVLQEGGSLCGWCEHGGTFGPRYFAGAQDNPEGKDAAKGAIRAFAEACYAG